MLVFAGAELIFTGVGLGFGFVQETVLVMQGCIQHWWAALTATAFSAPHTAPPARRLGLHSGLNPTDQRDIPQLVASCSALKPGARLAAGPLVGCMMVNNGFNLHHLPFLGFSSLCCFSFHHNETLWVFSAHEFAPIFPAILCPHPAGVKAGRWMCGA